MNADMLSHYDAGRSVAAVIPWDSSSHYGENQLQKWKRALQRHGIKFLWRLVDSKTTGGTMWHDDPSPSHVDWGLFFFGSSL